MKICKDCKHFKSGKNTYSDDACLHSRNTHPVHGGGDHSPRVLRDVGEYPPPPGACGRNGAWFEPIKPVDAREAPHWIKRWFWFDWG